jgi:hypothetical protein
MTMAEMPPRCVLPAVLQDPGVCLDFDGRQWDRLVRQARRGDVLGRLAAILAERDLLSQVPAKPRQHLEAARALGAKHLQIMRWEIECLQSALADTGVPVVFLKGAAYVVRELPPARGRFYTDVDIMVPKSDLGRVEKALLIHGWEPIKLDAYDQRYYRKWMHEIPPLRHRRRQTLVDVHHRILPETTKAQPDPILMLNRAEAIEGKPHFYTLAPVDMVLHSAAHLFYEGEFGHGLRDLADLDDLLRHWGEEEGFWNNLVARASELELLRPLYYALRYTQGILATPVPTDIVARVTDGGAPKGPVRRMMDGLFSRALLPEHAQCNTRFTAPSRWLLFIRGHVLRMPLHLLIPHLVRKAFKRDTDAGL